MYLIKGFDGFFHHTNDNQLYFEDNLVHTYPKRVISLVVDKGCPWCLLEGGDLYKEDVRQVKGVRHFDVRLGKLVYTDHYSQVFINRSLTDYPGGTGISVNTLGDILITGWPNLIHIEKGIVIKDYPHFFATYLPDGDILYLGLGHCFRKGNQEIPDTYDDFNIGTDGWLIWGCDGKYYGSIQGRMTNPPVDMAYSKGRLATISQSGEYGVNTMR